MVTKQIQSKLPFCGQGCFCFNSMFPIMDEEKLHQEPISRIDAINPWRCFVFSIAITVTVNVKRFFLLLPQKANMERIVNSGPPTTNCNTKSNEQSCKLKKQQVSKCFSEFAFHKVFLAVAQHCYPLTFKTFPGLQKKKKHNKEKHPAVRLLLILCLQACLQG